MPTGGNPNDYWGTQVTADYFRYNANYTPDISQNGGTVQQSGNLYGATLSLKLPNMQPDEFIDLSLRFGKMTGNYDQAIVQDTTHIWEAEAIYRYGLINRKAEDPKFKLDFLAGFDFQQWNYTDLVHPPYYWNLPNGGRSEAYQYNQSLYTINFGVGANCTG